MRAAIACVLSSLLVTFAPQSPRDNAPMGAQGTAAITGRVIDGESHGVNRAVVSLAGTGDASRAVITDDEGRFALTSVPAGRFLIRAQKPAYITTLYGSKRPGSGAGTTVIVSNGQRMDGLVITMLHGAAITGRVVSELGQPVAQMFVKPMQYQFRDGERMLVGLSASAITDDRGVYRIYGLVPGDYLVSLMPTSPLSARLVTPSDVAAAQDSGNAASSRPPAGADTDAEVGYAPLFYPASPDPSGATVISLAAGEERAGLDFTARFVGIATIEGSITRPPGTAATSARITILPSDLGIERTGFSNSTIAKPDGSFTLPGITPGIYTVMAVGRPTEADGARLFATTTLSIDSGGIKRVPMSLEPGMNVSGRIVFDGTTSQPAPDPARVFVEIEPANRGMASSIGVTAASGNPDGTFVIHGVAPGSYRLHATGPGASPPVTAGPWPIKSVTIDGRNAIDVPFDVKAGADISGAVITLTDKITQLTGVVQDAAGRPAPDYFLVVFSKDRRFWTARSRYVSSLVRPTSDGVFTVTGLPPGEYFMSVATDLVADDLGNPAVLEQLATQGISITLGEGERKTQDIRIGGHQHLVIW